MRYVPAPWAANEPRSSGASPTVIVPCFADTVAPEVIGVFAQSVAFVSGANPLGAVSSNGLALRVGNL